MILSVRVHTPETAHNCHECGDPIEIGAVGVRVAIGASSSAGRGVHTRRYHPDCWVRAFPLLSAEEDAAGPRPWTDADRYAAFMARLHPEGDTCGACRRELERRNHFDREPLQTVASAVGRDRP